MDHRSLLIRRLTRTGQVIYPPGFAAKPAPELSTNAAAKLAAPGAAFYLAVTPYDTNSDGVWEAAEQPAPASGLTHGTVARFGTHNPPVLSARDAVDVAAWSAAPHVSPAPFDTNHDGQLETSARESFRRLWMPPPTGRCFVRQRLMRMSHLPFD